MTTATFRCYWANGVEELTVALASPVHLTRLQHKIAPGGLSEFEPSDGGTLWVHDHRAAHTKYRMRQLSQREAQYLVAAAAATLQFAAFTGLRPCKRGGLTALEMDFRKTGVPLTFQSAWRHPVTGKYFLVGEPFMKDLPSMQAEKFDIQEAGNDQYIVSRRRSGATDFVPTRPLAVGGGK